MHSGGEQQLGRDRHVGRDDHALEDRRQSHVHHRQPPDPGRAASETAGTDPLPKLPPISSPDRREPATTRACVPRVGVAANLLN